MWLRGVFSGPPPNTGCCGEMGGDTVVLYDGSMDPTIKAAESAASVPWSTCSQELASCMGESQQEDDTPEADPLQLLPIEHMLESHVPGQTLWTLPNPHKLPFDAPALKIALPPGQLRNHFDPVILPLPVQEPPPEPWSPLRTVATPQKARVPRLCPSSAAPSPRGGDEEGSTAATTSAAPAAPRAAEVEDRKKPGVFFQSGPCTLWNESSM